MYELPRRGIHFVIKRGEQIIRSRSLWGRGHRDARARGKARSNSCSAGRGPAGQALLVFAAQFPGCAGGALPVTLVKAEDVTSIDAAIAEFRLKTFIALAVGPGAAADPAAGGVLVQGLAPLDEAVAACRRLGARPRLPIDATAPAEVQPMLDAVSRLAHHHTQRLTRIRHAVGNLSHALKTPLAVLAQAADEIGRRRDPALAALPAPPSSPGHARTVERELHRARLSGGGPVGRASTCAASWLGSSMCCSACTARRAIAIELEAPDERPAGGPRRTCSSFSATCSTTPASGPGARVRVCVLQPAGADGPLGLQRRGRRPGRARRPARPARHRPACAPTRASPA